MPAMTMTNKVYQPLEQAAHMTGAAKNIILEAALSRYFVELQEDAARADTLRQRGLDISLRLLNRIASEQQTGSICKNRGLSRPHFADFHISPLYKKWRNYEYRKYKLSQLSQNVF